MFDGIWDFIVSIELKNLITGVIGGIIVVILVKVWGNINKFITKFQDYFHQRDKRLIRLFQEIWRENNDLVALSNYHHRIRFKLILNFLLLIFGSLISFILSQIPSNDVVIFIVKSFSISLWILFAIFKLIHLLKLQKAERLFNKYVEEEKNVPVFHSHIL